MRRPPLSVIATWPAPNYENPDTRGPALLITESIFLALAWIILSLRLYVRIFILRKPWWDDWLMVLGAVRCILPKSWKLMLMPKDSYSQVV